MPTELATAYISLSANTKPLANDMKSFFRTLDKQGGKAAKGLAQDFDQELSKGSTRGAERLGKKVNDTLSKSTKGSGRRAAEQFETEAQARGRRVGHAVGTVIGKGMGAAISVGIAGAATVATAAVGTLTLALTKGFQRLKTIDQARFKLKALGHTAEEVATIMQSAEKAVKGTAFGLGEAATVAASAVAAGIEPGEELTKYLTLIADSAAVAGTSFEEMASIFNKVRTSNKAFTDDLRQLADRGIPVFQLLQKQFGVTAEELDKMVQDGKVSAADLEKALQSKLGGAASTIGGSFSSAVDNAEAALGRLGAALLKPAFEEASGQIGGVTAALDRMTAWVDNNQDVVIGFFGEAAKAAVTFGEAVLLTAEWTARGLGWIMNAVGDTYGSIVKVVSGVNRLLGRGEIADELLADAEAAFGMGDGLLDLADGAQNAQKPLQDLFWKIDEWKVGAQDAAREAQLFKDGLGDLAKKAEISSGTTIIKAPTAAELNAIDQAVFKVEQIPESQDFVVIPQTDEAAEALIAFRDKEAEKPVEVDATADTKPAEDGVGEWRTDEQGNPVKIEVAPQLEAANTAMQGFMAQWSQAVISPQISPGAPGGGPYNPLTGPVNSDGGGLLETASGLKQRYESMGFSNIGGYNPTVDQPWDEHQTGTSIDVPIPNWQSGGGGGAAVVADALRQPGTQHVIWQQKTYYPDGRVDAMPDRGSPTENHLDHVHIKTYDQGGIWPDGELGINTTGEDELVLNPDQLQSLTDQGVDPNTLIHGTSGGAPGPAPGGPQQPSPGGDLATEGLIPAMAANTNPVGQGGLSNFLDLGESFVHGLIDTAADLGSMAVSAAAAAGTSGAGAAAGPAASAGIKMAAEAGKRGVSWGYDMAGIWGEALIEQLMPFGAPHWAGTNPMAFMPQGNPLAQFMPKEPGTMGQTPGDAAPPDAATDAAAGGTPPVQDNAHAGSGAMPGPGATPPMGAPMGGPGPNMEQVQAMAMDPSTWLSGLFGGTYDQGGVLPPESFGVNLSNQPEYVLTQSQWKAMQSGGMQVEGRKGETNNFYAQDVDGMFREYNKHNRRQSRQYAGRP